tara:strand:- start:2883 stop:3212 length:330 start_codon:yes stop_codon:yes gene_type:complete
MFVKLFKERKYSIFMVWRDKIDPLLKPHLEVQLKESLRQKSAIKSSSNPREAQLWCAIANLSQQNYMLRNRVKNSEKLLVKLLNEKVSKSKSLKEKQELKKIIDTMQKF